MNQYILIVESEGPEFLDKVNAAINCGWTPQGGITVNDEGMLYQAMIRIKQEEEEEG
jgi:hypothetical protein